MGVIGYRDADVVPPTDPRSWGNRTLTATKSPDPFHLVPQLDRHRKTIPSRSEYSLPRGYSDGAKALTRRQEVARRTGDNDSANRSGVVWAFGHIGLRPCNGRQTPMTTNAGPAVFKIGTTDSALSSFLGITKANSLLIANRSRSAAAPEPPRSEPRSASIAQPGFLGEQAPQDRNVGGPDAAATGRWESINRLLGGTHTWHAGCTFRFHELSLIHISEPTRPY